MPLKITWIGLNLSGKTALIQRLISGVFPERIYRTLGMNVEKIEFQDTQFISWDIGGAPSHRQHLWDIYMMGSAGVVFVVDSTDDNRLCEARDEFWTHVVNNANLQQKPVLILANKQDLPEAISVTEIASTLGLYRLSQMRITIFPTSALTGLNLEEAFSWLARQTTCECLDTVFCPLCGSYGILTEKKITGAKQGICLKCNNVIW